MEKLKLEGFINRYNLGGEIESVVIDSNDNNMSVSIITDDRTMLGDVTVEIDDFPNGQYGIYMTSLLKSLLNVLDNEVNVEEVTGALRFSDGNTKAQYMLASPTVIPKVPSLKQLPEFDAEIVINDEFINKYIKSITAMNQAESATFVSRGGVCEIILGYSEINSHRISITVDCECDGDVEPISFSSKMLKSILLANRGASTSTMKISKEGLAALQFVSDNYTCNYYLTKND